MAITPSARKRLKQELTMATQSDMHADRDASEVLTQQEWERALEDMRTAGEQAGKAAGSWVVDGNTSEETKNAIRDGMNDCDPEVMDSLPELQLGQWADDPTVADLIEEHTTVDAATITPEEEDDLFRAYADGWYDGMTAEVERSVS